MKFSESLQKILPFGYLYLVLMGILKESVFYYQIGINILKYSSIMDILISPVATITAQPIILLALIIIIIFCYALPKFLSKLSNRKWIQKTFGLKSKDDLSSEVIQERITDLFIKYLAVGLLAFFLGIGIGEGVSLSKKIKSNNLVYKHKLNYSSGDSEQVYLINTNSVYYFYLAKGNKAIKIAPIGAIKSIELTDNKMLK